MIPEDRSCINYDEVEFKETSNFGTQSERKQLILDTGWEKLK